MARGNLQPRIRWLGRVPEGKSGNCGPLLPIGDVAEGVGFEPTVACATTVFKFGARHADTSLGVPHSAQLYLAHIRRVL